jgi:hypothetical protein
MAIGCSGSHFCHNTMTLGKRIRNWLNDPADYAVGIALLRETGKVSAFLMGLLERSDDEWNRARLIQELEPYAAAEPGTDAPETPTEKPAPVLALEGQAGRLMDERVELKAGLRALAENETAAERRRVMALRVLAIGRELDGVYGQLRFWQEYGYLPVERDPDVDADERATLLNVRTYVSRYKRKLGKLQPTSTAYAETEKLLKHYEAEKARLEAANGLI